MPLNAIEIMIETIELPAGWITAKEANEIATSIKNETFINYVNAIMKEIREAAAAGRTSTSYFSSIISNEIFDRAVDFLRQLDYTVGMNSGKTIIYPSW